MKDSWCLLQDLWKFVARVGCCDFLGCLYCWPGCIFDCFFIVFCLFVTTFNLAELGFSVFVSSGFQDTVLRKLTEVVVLWFVVRLLRPTLGFVDYVFLGVFGESLGTCVYFDLVLKFFEESLRVGLSGTSHPVPRARLSVGSGCTPRQLGLVYTAHPIFWLSWVEVFFCVFGFRVVYVVLSSPKLVLYARPRGLYRVGHLGSFAATSGLLVGNSGESSVGTTGGPEDESLCVFD